MIKKAGGFLMNLLVIGISGVRGILGETLKPELILNFACAFGAYVQNSPVCVGWLTVVVA
jgi:phosphomannomutase